MRLQELKRRERYLTSNNCRQSELRAGGGGGSGREGESRREGGGGGL